jgi:hypothetical protein
MRGRPVLWTPRRVVKLRGYAERGFSQAEAAKLLDVTYGAVINEASRLGISFHGPPGAPKMNRNHKLGEWRKGLRKLAAD